MNIHFTIYTYCHETLKSENYTCLHSIQRHAMGWTVRAHAEVSLLHSEAHAAVYSFGDSFQADEVYHSWPFIDEINNSWGSSFTFPYVIT
jgi:hypothetical protein